MLNIKFFMLSVTFTKEAKLNKAFLHDLFSPPRL